MKQTQIPHLLNLVLINACLTFLCCSYAYSQSATTTVDLEGVAVTRTGTIVSGAKITLVCQCNECPTRPCSECCPSGFSATAVTDEEGRFKIKNVPAGVYFLTGEASGFKEAEVHSVEVGQHAGRSINVVFDTGGAREIGESKGSNVVDANANEKTELQVKVVDRETKKPLENAKIRLLFQCDCKKECPTKPCSECCPSEITFAGTTDASGVVNFSGPAGTYLIDTAYRAYSKETLVTLKDGEKEKVKIALTMVDRPND